MLHTEPSFSVYADEDGLLDSRNGDMKVKIGSDEFSFTENMGLSVENRKDDLLSGFKDLGVLDAEDDYKRMLDEDPSNPVYLKKYAHLLQLNGDVKGAEEYYFRATMADPKDGETLMQYAKLVWELHHDQDRALGYFQSAVHASPHDPNVLAAYARFLWEIDEEEEKNNESIMLPVNVDGLSTNELEKYYNKMIQANPSNSDVLAAYAKFLWEADDQED